jgi:hypothetical protein
MGPAMSLALCDAQINHILLTTGPLQPKERAAFDAAHRFSRQRPLLTHLRSQQLLLAVMHKLVQLMC